MKNLKGYQPFVFGMYIVEGLKAASAAKEVVLVGRPSLLLKWAEPSLRGMVLNPDYGSKRRKQLKLESLGEKVLQKAREINPRVRKAILLGVGEWE